VTNWSAYNEALRQRGSLTVWFTDEAIAAWKAAPRTTPGGQPHYSDLAITTALTLRAVFHLPLPDFSTLSRRAQSLELPAQPRAPGGPIHLLVDSSGFRVAESTVYRWVRECRREGKRAPKVYRHGFVSVLDEDDVSAASFRTAFDRGGMTTVASR
jgi:hypothetical protein